MQINAVVGEKGDQGDSITSPPGQDATNLIHVTDGQGTTVEISNPTILSFQKCLGEVIGGTVAQVTPIFPTVTSGTAINIVTDTQGHTINNTQTFAAGTGLSLAQTGDSHTFTNAHPMTIVNADGACYMPGALSELIFANTSASLADGKLTLAHKKQMLWSSRQAKG